MSFFGAIKSCFSNYASFQGRARRKEFWYFRLFYAIFMSIIRAITANFIIRLIASFIFFFPMLSVTVRRFHDIGEPSALPIFYSVLDVIIVLVFTGTGDISGFMWVLIAVYSLTAIYITVFACKDSLPETNEYGPNPKINEVLVETTKEDLPVILNGSSTNTSTNNSSEAIFCHKCGAKLIEGSDFCHRCGTSVFKG